MARGDLAVIRAAQNRGTSAILLRPVNHVGKLIVGDDMVELRRWLVVPCTPGLTTIKTDRRSLIRSKDHTGRVPGIDPDLGVVIPARRAADNGKCLAGIF